LRTKGLVLEPISRGRSRGMSFTPGGWKDGA
jgi:hypothetical protein